MAGPKSRSLATFKEKVINKLKGWKKRLLDQASKEVLVKSVILAMPTYVMPCCKLPKGLCEEISKEMAKFWWGEKEKEKRIHWMNWKRMTEIKGKGGLGFRTRDLLERGARKRVGDRRTIDIWRDKWIMDRGKGKVFNSKPPNCQLRW